MFSSVKGSFWFLIIFSETKINFDKVQTYTIFILLHQMYLCYDKLNLDVYYFIKLIQFVLEKNYHQVFAQINSELEVMPGDWIIDQGNARGIT